MPTSLRCNMLASKSLPSVRREVLQLLPFIQSQLVTHHKLAPMLVPLFPSDSCISIFRRWYLAQKAPTTSEC